MDILVTNARMSSNLINNCKKNFSLIENFNEANYYYHTSGCCVAIATQQPDVLTYTGIYQMWCTAYKVALEDGLI